MNWFDALATKRRIRPARPFEAAEVWMLREEERVTEALEWEAEPTLDAGLAVSTLELALKTLSFEVRALEGSDRPEDALRLCSLAHVQDLLKKAIRILEGGHEKS